MAADPDLPGGAAPASAADLVARVCSAYEWHKALGHETVTPGELGRVVREPDHPELWDGNHLSGVAISSAEQLDALLRFANDQLAHCDHRMVLTNPRSHPLVEARLALDGYEELPPTLQLVLRSGRPLAPVSSPALTFTPVVDDDHWERLAALAAIDATEGRRSGDIPPAVVDRVVAGLVAGYRAAEPASRFHLVEEAGADCAYGSAVTCPGGVGIVEDLFTLPEHRGRGIASGLIARLVAQLRAAGCDLIVIGSLTSEPPKRLYAALGFEPLCVTRAWVRQPG